MVKAAKEPAEYILPLDMNGLSGRMLKLPAKGKHRREILLIYGHHASIERMMGLAEYLSRYGSVTMPDLPGFGGMEPFYKIGQKPTLDALADYLAAFVKLRYTNRRLTIVGVSLAVPIVTRMLQKYPELVKKVDLLVSVVGFAHKNDFVFKRRNFLFFRLLASVCSRRIPALIAKHLILRPAVIKLAYKLGEEKNYKLRDASEEQRKERVNFEVILWRINDFRTYAETSVSMLSLKQSPKHVALPIHHVAISGDRYFNNVSVEQHMREVYQDFYIYTSKVALHTPSIVAEAKDVAPLIPPKLRTVFRKSAARKDKL